MKIKTSRSLLNAMLLRFLSSFFVPRTPLTSRPFHNFPVTILCCLKTSRFVPRATLFSCVFEYLQLALLRSIRASPLVPWASLRSRPLEHCQEPSLRCKGTRVFVPRAAFASRPLENVEVTSFSRPSTSEFVPRGPLVSRPHQTFQFAARCCQLTRAFVPRTAFTSCPLQDTQIAAMSCGTASPFIPRATLLSQILQHVHESRSCRKEHGFCVKFPAFLLLQILQDVEVSLPHCKITRPLIRRTLLSHQPLERSQVTSFRGKGTRHFIPMAAFASSPFEDFKLTPSSSSMTEWTINIFLRSVRESAIDPLQQV